MEVRTVETKRGIRCAVREAGDGPPLVYLHGVLGLRPEEPLLDRLADGHPVGIVLQPDQRQEDQLLEFAEVVAFAHVELH